MSEPTPPSDHGPVVDLAKMDEDVAVLLSLPIGKARDAFSQAFYLCGQQRRPFDAQVFFVSNGGVNALAKQSDATGCTIRFFTGMAVVLFEACLKFASRLELGSCRPVCEGGRQLVYPKRLPIITARADLDGANENQLSQVLVRLAEAADQNAALGLLLFNLASWFVAMHEVMHVVQGHTAYVREHFLMEELLEFSDARQTRLDPAFSQMLEFIADRNAIRGLAVRLLEGDLDASHADLLRQITVDKPEFMLRALISAVTLLLHLFPRRFCSVERFLGSHPHPYVRMHWMIMEVGYELDGRIEFEPTVLSPLAETCATLAANFDTGENWWEHTRRDRRDRVRDGRIPRSDELYATVVAKAHAWQADLWKFSPLYPDDPRLPAAELPLGC